MYLKARKKMKRWKKALIITPIALAVSLGLCCGLWMLSFVIADKYNLCSSCFRKIGEFNAPDAVVSAELVSQKKPIVIHDLKEYPKIKGIKVKLTYEDGSSSIMRAHNLKFHCIDGFLAIPFENHCVGMFLDIGYYESERSSTLKPGLNQVAMYCLDRVWGEEDYWSLHRRNSYFTDDDTSSAYCMVDVMYMPKESIEPNEPAD